MILNEEELQIFHQLYEKEGGEFVTVISPNSRLPYTTPVNFILYNSRFYTSTNREAAKIKFIREGSDKGNITFYINGSARKPYIGMTGTFRLLGEDKDQKIIQDTEEFRQSLIEQPLSDHTTPGAIEQLENWLDLEDRLVIEFTPESVYGKTRGAL